jgi:hypothetical protein
MDAFDKLLAAVDQAITNTDKMIQNADSSSEKDDVKNEDAKDDTIKNLQAKIANLEERLKNSEGKEDDVKNSEEEKILKNLASRIANLLKNSDDKDESVKNKGVKNAEAGNEAVSNLATQLLNALRNCDKGTVKNSEDEDESVKNKGVKNSDDDKKDDVQNEEELDKKIANLMARITNVEAQLKNSNDEDDEVKNSDDDKDDVQNTDDEDESVKNKGVKNKGVKNKGLRNTDDKKDEAVVNAVSEVIAEMAVTQRRAINDLMDMIVTNSRGVYSKDDLAGKSKDELQKLSRLLSRQPSMPVANASMANIHMSASVLNEEATLDIPSTFPTKVK